MGRAPKTPAFPFYGKDAYDDEAFRQLPFGAQGLYLFLAWWQWQEGSIPADLEAILDAVPRKKIWETRRLWPSVERFFPVEADDQSRRANEKVEEHRRKLCGERARKRVGADMTNLKLGRRSPLSEVPPPPADAGEQQPATSAAETSNAPGARSQLTPQQEAVKLVIEAFPENLRPHPGLAARWITQIAEGRNDPDLIAAAEVVREIVWKYPSKGADYISKCVTTAAVEARTNPQETQHATSRRSDARPGGSRKRGRDFA